eukprot:1353510-Rhodomonas_salina.3
MHTTAGADTRLRVRRFPLLRLTQICFKFKPSRPELASQCASESESLNFQISCFARYKKLTASTARSEEAVALRAVFGGTRWELGTGGRIDSILPSPSRALSAEFAEEDLGAGLNKLGFGTGF